MASLVPSVRYLIRRYPAGGHHQRGEYEDPTHDGARHE
jgi:hypothetical protein